MRCLSQRPHETRASISGAGYLHEPLTARDGGSKAIVFRELIINISMDIEIRSLLSPGNKNYVISRNYPVILLV
jgi:hypothetical protein